MVSLAVGKAKPFLKVGKVYKLGGDRGIGGVMDAEFVGHSSKLEQYDTPGGYWLFTIKDTVKKGTPEYDWYITVHTSWNDRRDGLKKAYKDRIVMLASYNTIEIPASELTY